MAHVFGFASDGNVINNVPAVVMNDDFSKNVDVFVRASVLNETKTIFTKMYTPV